LSDFFFFAAAFFSPFLLFSILSDFSSFGAGVWAKLCGAARPIPRENATPTTSATSFFMICHLLSA